MNKDRLQMYVSVINITIIVCWLSLFCFWAVKIFGGNWFEIAVHNEKIIALSAKIQNSWLRYLSSFITIFIARYFIIGAICQKFYFKGKCALFVYASIVSMWVVVDFIHIDAVKMWYGYIVMLLVGIIYHKGWKRLLGAVSIAIELVFSLVSMLTRNIQLQVIDDYLISMVGSIDLYIMFILYYLYSNLIRLRKEI